MYNPPLIESALTFDICNTNTRARNKKQSISRSSY